MKHALERAKNFNILLPAPTVEYGARGNNAQVFSCPLLSSTLPDDLITQIHQTGMDILVSVNI
jgi:hypothetical protein